MTRKCLRLGIGGVGVGFIRGTLGSRYSLLTINVSNGSSTTGLKMQLSLLELRLLKRPL